MTQEATKFKRIGKNIAKYRKKSGYSQNKLAELLDISREHLAKIETAKKGISFKLFFQIAETLNIPEAKFFED